ncbi:MAG: translation initiation factor IF-2 [Planctomycetota bacterium]
MLAKELDLGNQTIIDHLAQIGVSVPNHMTVLTDDVVKAIRKFFAIDSNLEATRAKERETKKKVAAAKAVEKKEQAAKKKAAAKKKKAVKKKVAKQKAAPEEKAAAKKEKAVEKKVTEEKKPEEAAEAATDVAVEEAPPSEKAKKPKSPSTTAKAKRHRTKIVGKSATEVIDNWEGAVEDKVERVGPPKRRGAVKVGRINIRPARREGPSAPAKPAPPRRTVRPAAKAAPPTVKRRIDIIKTSPRQRIASRQKVPFLKERISIRRKTDARRRRHQTTATPARSIEVPDAFEVTMPVNAKDLAAKLGVRASAILTILLKNSIFTRINDPLGEEAIELIGLEHNKEITVKKPKDIEDTFREFIVQPRPEHAEPRAPVITFLGHVDHGKTSLLDRIRFSKVVEGESGGITQHIGAYSVSRNNRALVFVDTPGHKAFTEMRARGANVTDVVVLVVAVDDGVMPQTEEAINHARAANVPMVVALNKIDKQNANILKTKQQLAAIGLNPEEWGGETVCVEVSATTGQGVDELLEMLILQADMLELKADPGIPARGTVLEAKVSEDLGVVATLLITEGTLKRGDTVVVGSTYGRIRSITDDTGKEMLHAGPAVPIGVTGLGDVPAAGDKFFAIDNLQKAREIALKRTQRSRQVALVSRGGVAHVTLENLFSQIEAGKIKELPLIIKADVQGSIEVLRKSLEELSTSEVRIKILHIAAGGITESDVMLADASDAVIVGFHVVPDVKARNLAEERKVDIRLFRVIYEAVDTIKAAMSGMLDPEERETVLGTAVVKQCIKISRIGTVAGCAVTSGKILRSAKVRVSRDGVLVFEGDIQTLRRFKEDVREAAQGFECGIKVAGFNDFKEGDVMEAYQIEKIKREL